MARMARLVVPNFPHHITQRGNRRQRTFFCEADYRYYIELVAKYARKAKTDIWAYCLMPNHVHLVMVPSTEDGLRATLGEAHRHYTRHVNFREKWRGHLWQERFHSFPMDEDYLIATVRYVERNPIAAKLCACPEAWMWSSAQAHINGKDDELVKVQPMLDRIGDWSAYLADANRPESDQLIAQHSQTGRPLGSIEFVRELELITGESLAPKKPGRKAITTK